MSNDSEKVNEKPEWTNFQRLQRFLQSSTFDASLGSGGRPGGRQRAGRALVGHSFILGFILGFVWFHFGLYIDSYGFRL